VRYETSAGWVREGEEGVYIPLHPQPNPTVFTNTSCSLSAWVCVAKPIARKTKSAASPDMESSWEGPER
jgi:hypothetical protein